jgi:hypothetical protein
MLLSVRATLVADTVRCPVRSTYESTFSCSRSTCCCLSSILRALGPTASYSRGTWFCDASRSDLNEALRGATGLLSLCVLPGPLSGVCGRCQAGESALENGKDAMLR